MKIDEAKETIVSAEKKDEPLDFALKHLVLINRLMLSISQEISQFDGRPGQLNEPYIEDTLCYLKVLYQRASEVFQEVVDRIQKD